MLTNEKITKCLDILSEAYCQFDDDSLSVMLLEIGYILNEGLKQDVPPNRNLQLDKLLKDNKELYAENKKLTESVNKLKSIIDNEIKALKDRMDATTRVIQVNNPSLLMPQHTVRSREEPYRRRAYDQ